MSRDRHLDASSKEFAVHGFHPRNEDVPAVATAGGEPVPAGSAQLRTEHRHIATAEWLI